MSTEDLTRQNLIPKLLDAVPELRERQETLVRDGEFFGPYSTFDNVVVPYLLALVECGGPDEILTRIFAFLEAMARSEDQKVGEVLGVSVCEYISGWSYLHRAWPYMGRETRAVAREMAEGWGHPLPEDDDPYAGIDRERYTQRFREELDSIGGLQRVTGVDIGDIRERLFRELGMPTDRV